MKKCFFTFTSFCIVAISYFRHHCIYLIYILFEKCENGDDIGDYFWYCNKYNIIQNTKYDKKSPNNDVKKNLYIYARKCNIEEI